MVHPSLIGGLIFVLNGAPAPTSCIDAVEVAFSSISSLTKVDLSVQQDKVDLLYTVVPERDWTYAAVERLMHRGVIRGYPYGYFSDKPLRTRYDFAVAIQRAASTYSEAVKQQETPAKAVPWQGEGDLNAGPPPPPPAEDLKLLRKLHLEYKAQVARLGEDWAATDGRLQKMQDQVLHRDLASALAAGLPKADEAAPGLGTKVVPRPNWAYDSLKQLHHTKDSSIPEGRLLTRAEFAAVVNSAVGDFLANEQVQNYTEPMPQPFQTPYQLSEIIALHRLLHAFRFEIAPSGRDVVEVEKRLAKAEEKRIAEEEIIDTKPPVPPVNP